MPIPLIGSLVEGLRSPLEPSGYPENWSEISSAFRKEHGYKCDMCGVDCSEHPHLTDAHHIDSDKSNCDYKNLQCLCKYHHAEKHSHYKINESDQKKLKKLWQEQNIQKNTPLDE